MKREEWGFNLSLFIDLLSLRAQRGNLANHKSDALIVEIAAVVPPSQRQESCLPRNDKV